MKSTIHEHKNLTLKFLSKKLLLIVFTAIALFACKKEDEPTLIEELSKSNWRKTQILFSTDSTTSNPADTVPAILLVTNDCKKDNIWSFDATNNTFKLDEGATKCNPSDSQTKDAGTISELNNGSSLRVASDGTNEIWEIESRSASSFRVSYFARNSDNVTVKFRVTFSKI